MDNVETVECGESCGINSYCSAEESNEGRWDQLGSRVRQQRDDYGYNNAMPQFPLGKPLCKERVSLRIQGGTVGASASTEVEVPSGRSSTEVETHFSLSNDDKSNEVKATFSAEAQTSPYDRSPPEVTLRAEVAYDFKF